MSTLSGAQGRTRPYKALVFDFDGTLSRLTLDFENMRQEVMRVARRHLPDAPDNKGRLLLEWLQELALELNSRDKPTAASLLLREAHQRIREIEVLTAQNGDLFPFTRPLLSTLQKCGVKTAIVTRNCKPALLAAFPDVLLHASHVLTRDDVSKVKPDPEHLGHALQLLDCSAEDALMVGDHPLDIATGRNVGADSAGVASGRIPLMELEAAGACHVAQDCLELCRELSRQGLLPYFRL